MLRIRLAASDEGSRAATGRNAALYRHLLLGLALLGAPAAAQAQQAEAGPAPSDYIADLKLCREIVAAPERLACFDRTVEAVVAAADTGEVSLIGREDVRQTRRSLFGFTMPEGGIFGRSDDEDDTSMLESTITGVSRLRGDTYVITIAEGSKWQMSNVPMRLRAPRVGDAVVFKKASLSSYFIRIGGQLGVKGRRIE